MKNVLNNFYKNAYTIFEGIEDETQAQDVLQDFISKVDAKVLPLFKNYKNRIEFLNVKAIPAGDDIENSFQALHFDDGHPFIYKDFQKIYLMTALFLPPDRKLVGAKTRIVPIKGILKPLKATDVEERVIEYIKKRGDGWTFYKNTNSGRLCCFAKVLEAVRGEAELPDYIDWFFDTDLSKHPNSLDVEKEFYLKHGLDLNKLEIDLPLNPGSMLLFDDTRVIHGRLGKRSEHEVWQFLVGIKKSTKKDVKILRKYLSRQMT